MVCQRLGLASSRTLFSDNDREGESCAILVAEKSELGASSPVSRLGAESLSRFWLSGIVLMSLALPSVVGRLGQGSPTLGANERRLVVGTKRPSKPGTTRVVESGRCGGCL